MAAVQTSPQLPMPALYHVAEPLRANRRWCWRRCGSGAMLCNSLPAAAREQGGDGGGAAERRCSGYAAEPLLADKEVVLAAVWQAMICCNTAGLCKTKKC